MAIRTGLRGYGNNKSAVAIRRGTSCLGESMGLEWGAHLHASLQFIMKAVVRTLSFHQYCLDSRTQEHGGVEFVVSIPYSEIFSEYSSFPLSPK